jgi:hypothetical protein
MARRFWFSSVVCTLALASACSRQSTSPSSPSGLNSPTIHAAADGTTLKASAPTPQAPINGLKLVQGVPLTLVINNSTTTYASGIALTYTFELYNAGGTKVYTSPSVSGGTGTTSHVVTLVLDGEQPYTWRARAE